MIINDLNYLENITEEVQIIGAGRPRLSRRPSATAIADATSDAIGYRTRTETLTQTQAVAGLFSYSGSSSYASASGLPIA